MARSSGENPAWSGPTSSATASFSVSVRTPSSSSTIQLALRRVVRVGGAATAAERRVGHLSPQAALQGFALPLLLGGGSEVVEGGRFVAGNGCALRVLGPLPLRVGILQVGDPLILELRIRVRLRVRVRHRSVSIVITSSVWNQPHAPDSLVLTLF
jgi:hypothetical protein